MSPVTSAGWSAIFAVLALVGAGTRDLLLFVLGTSGVLVALTSGLWQRYGLVGVTYRRTVSQSHAFFGEEIDLVLEVTNRKVLPLPWLEVEDDVPESLTYLNALLGSSYKAKRRTLVHLCSLRWYERVRRRYRIRCSHRGLHEFGPATLWAGDLFGLTLQRREVPEVTRLIVYPKIVPLERLGLEVSGPFGDLVKPRTLWEDPTWVAGVRPYQPGDPLRRVHWKASARLGHLHVKLLEPTTHPRLAIFLDMHTLLGHAWWAGYDPLLVELSIVVAASLATWAAEQHLPVGLFANGPRFRGEGPATVALPPSEHPEHLRRILEALATLIPVATTSLGDLLRTEAPGLAFGATIIAITAVPDPDSLDVLERLRAEGHPVGMILVGSRAPAVSAGDLPVFRIQGEEAWRDIARITVG